MEILQRKRLKVIIPFYKNSHLVDSLFESLVSCASEFNSLGAELILINDSPDDPQLSAELEKWLKSNTRLNLRLITNSKNLGFLKSINQGLKIVIEAKDDVLLLNSDTYIFPEALRELSEVAYSDPMIGFVSPRSNNATLCTLPSNGGLKDSPIEYYKDFLLLKNYFHRTSYVPTVVGFCMFIKSEILLNFGVLDPIYGYGYSEENDLIMRANKCGYKAALANHAFVWHKGSASFGLDEGSVIKAENEVLLNKRYPEYEPLIFRYFDSPEFRAEKLVAGLMPDRQGKFIIGFDCRNIGTYFNGTALAARELIFSAAKYWPNNIRIKVMMSLEAWNFHKFSENTRIEWLNPLDASAPMGAVVRIGQPFLTGDIDTDSENLIKLIKPTKVNVAEELIIIGTYPNTIKRKQLTIDCINSLRPTGRKIMLVSHYPVSDEIQQMVDYYVYDSHNPTTHHSYYTRFYHYMPDFDVDININGLRN